MRKPCLPNFEGFPPLCCLKLLNKARFNFWAYATQAELSGQNTNPAAQRHTFRNYKK